MDKLTDLNPPMIAFMEGADKSEDEQERKGHVVGLTEGKEKKKNAGEETAFLYSGKDGDEKAKGVGDSEDLVYDGGDGEDKNNGGAPQDRRSRDTVRIVDDDIERLEGGTWLNDNLVDMWMKFVAGGDVESVNRVVSWEVGSDEEVETTVMGGEEVDDEVQDSDEEDEVFVGTSPANALLRGLEEERRSRKATMEEGSQSPPSPAVSSVETAASQDHSLDPEDFHVFTSHFFTTLATSGYDAVRSWVKDVPKFLQKKYVFVPICRDMHWR